MPGLSGLQPSLRRIKPGIRSLEPGHRSQEPGLRNLKLGLRGPKPKPKPDPKPGQALKASTLVSQASIQSSRTSFQACSLHGLKPGLWKPKPDVRHLQPGLRGL